MSLMKSPTLFGQCLSEFLGTALLVFFGLGCVAAVRIAGAQLGLWEVSIIWGLGVALAVYLTAGSPAHISTWLSHSRSGCLPALSAAK